MERVTFRFFGELNDFLSPSQRDRTIPFPLREPASVKHPIESLGIPHPEVGRIDVDGAPVDFAYQLTAGLHVNVYPAGTEQPASAVVLRPPLALPIRFVADTHLGQLARYLRLFGFDTLYRNDYEDAELAQISSREGRVLLTRDRGLLKRRIVVYGRCVRRTDPRRQIVDVLRRYRLRGAVQPWSRCVNCNGLLAAVEKEAVWDRLEPKTKLYYDHFQQCSRCGQIYWQGTHFERMQQFVQNVLADVGKSEQV